MKRLVTTLALAVALSAAQLGLPAPAMALYILAYGDNIAIQVKDAPQFNGGGAIRPDGVITIPYVGDLEVAGLTPMQLREKLTQILSRYIPRPEVTVNVTGFRPMPVVMLGEVKSPGVRFITRANTTLYDMIADAGGFTDRAVPTEVVLIRGDGASAKRMIINVDEMQRTGDFSNNVLIQQGDRIQVKEVWWPNLREWREQIVIVTGFITAIGTIFVLYDRASRTE